MTHNKLIKEYVRLTENNNLVIGGVTEAIKQLNDNSILHAQVLKTQTEAIKEIRDFWSNLAAKVIIMLLIALIFLAGGEKIIKSLGI